MLPPPPQKCHFRKHAKLSNNSLMITLNLINYAPKVTQEDDRMILPSLLSTFGRCQHRPCGACTPVFVWSTCCRPCIKSSGSRVDGLLHSNGDEAITVIPCHNSSVAASLFVAHHPRHHHPCHPHPLLHHCYHPSLACHRR